MEKELLEYKNATLCLAFNLALQSYFAEQYRQGRSVGVEAMQKALSKTARNKARFLEAKKALGLTGGLDSFQSDGEYHFQGFDIVGGVFTGDPKKVDEICQKYFDELNAASAQDMDDELATRFEVAAFAFMLSGDARSIYLDAERKENKPSVKELLKGILSKILSFFGGMESLEDAV